MFVKQLSVFLENRPGRLEEVTEVLRQNEINIVSLSLADTNEYGLLRMIVSDPDKAKRILNEGGYSAILTDVIAVQLPHAIGMLQELLKVLSDHDINVEYMYILASKSDKGAMIIKASDPEKAVRVLEAGGMPVYAPEDAYTLHDR